MKKILPLLFALTLILLTGCGANGDTAKQPDSDPAPTADQAEPAGTSGPGGEEKSPETTEAPLETPTEAPTEAPTEPEPTKEEETTAPTEASTEARPDPEPTEPATEPEPVETVPEDGTYTASVTLEGGSGRATVESPATLRCEGGKFWATIVWSSPNFDYMKVDGEKYLQTNTEGNSTFEIPVSAFDQKLDVIADTVAMSEPHEVEYTLCFDSASLTKQ